MTGIQIVAFIIGWSLLAVVGWRIVLRVRRLELEHQQAMEIIAARDNTPKETGGTPS